MNLQTHIHAKRTVVHAAVRALIQGYLGWE